MEVDQSIKLFILLIIKKEKNNFECVHFGKYVAKHINCSIRINIIDLMFLFPFTLKKKLILINSTS